MLAYPSQRNSRVRSQQPSMRPTSTTPHLPRCIPTMHAKLAFPGEAAVRPLRRPRARACSCRVATRPAQPSGRSSHNAQRSQHGCTIAAAAAGPGSVDLLAADGANVAPQVLAGKTVGIVGGGPGGMLCAAHLARLGAAVEVFERHDPAAAGEGRPPQAVWSIAMGAPARKAIAAAGLQSDFGPRYKCVFQTCAYHTS